MASIWDQLEAMRLRNEVSGPTLRATPENPLQRWMRQKSVALADAIAGENTSASHQIERGLTGLGALLAGGLEPGGPERSITAFAKAGVPEAIARASKSSRAADRYVKSTEQILNDIQYSKSLEEALAYRDTSLAKKVMGLLSGKTSKAKPQTSPDITPSQLRDIALVGGKTDRRQFLGGLLSKMIKPTEAPVVARPPSEIDLLTEAIMSKLPWISRDQISIRPVKQWDVVDTDTAEVLTESFPKFFQDTKPTPQEFRQLLKDRGWLDDSWVGARVRNQHPNVTIHDKPMDAYYITAPSVSMKDSVSSVGTKEDILRHLEHQAQDEIEIADRVIRDNKFLSRTTDRLLRKIPMQDQASRDLKNEVWHAAITEQVPVAKRDAWRKNRMLEESARATKWLEKSNQDQYERELRWMYTGKFE